MFTGIIEATAEVIALGGGKLTTQRPPIFNDVHEGSSIAVAGVCLTVVSLSPHALTFDVVPTTLGKTKLGSLRTGERVNLERALRASGRLEGHMVQGHCEAIGLVLDTEVKGGSVMLSVEVPEVLTPFIVPQGSVAIDGVSLTVANIQDQTLTVALVPYTCAQTTLGTLKQGDSVNIETDIIGRYSQKLVHVGS